MIQLREVLEELLTHNDTNIYFNEETVDLGILFLKLMKDDLIPIALFEEVDKVLRECSPSE